MLGSGQLVCAFCSARLEVSVERAPSAIIEPPAEPDVKKENHTPWEDRGALFGFLLTIWSALTSPTSFFKNLGNLGIGRAPSFALLILVPAVIVQACAFRYLRDASFNTDAMIRFSGLVLCASLLTIAYLGAFYQLAATVMSGRRVAVPATVRVLCFGFAPMILAIVPVAGFAIGLSWSLVLHAIALREVHGLTRLKSFAVVMLPVALAALQLW